MYVFDFAKLCRGAVGVFWKFSEGMMLHRCVRSLICYIFWNNSSYNCEKNIIRGADIKKNIYLQGELTIRISNMCSLNDLLKVTSFIDEARWKDVTEQRRQGRMLINYSDPKWFRDNPDGRILTHYLCYITDRQMPYERIWNVGGFVFSNLIKKYQQGTSTNRLLSLPEDSRDCDAHIQIEQSDRHKETLKFVSKGIKPTKTQKYLLGSTYENKNVVFASRFVTTDFRNIYNVLYILEKLQKEKVIPNRSLVEYIKEVIRAYPKEKIVKRIAYALYLLTYKDVNNRNSKESVDAFVRNTKEESNRQYKMVHAFLKGQDEHDVGFNDYCNNQNFSSKRIWCSIRDYILDPEFKEFFISEIRKELNDDINKMEYLKQLELPGDVWNNNSHFLDCNIKRSIPNEYKSPFNKYLRNLIKERDDIKEGYVAQFDITFSLTPRMCEKLECDYCPYGILYEKRFDGVPYKHHFEEMCVDNREKLCPIILHSTGYKSKCVGTNNCILHKIWKNKQLRIKH